MLQAFWYHLLQQPPAREQLNQERGHISVIPVGKAYNSPLHISPPYLAFVPPPLHYRSKRTTKARAGIYKYHLRLGKPSTESKPTEVCSYSGLIGAHPSPFRMAISAAVLSPSACGMSVYVGLDVGGGGS